MGELSRKAVVCISAKLRTRIKLPFNYEMNWMSLGHFLKEPWSFMIGVDSSYFSSYSISLQSHCQTAPTSFYWPGLVMGGYSLSVPLSPLWLFLLQHTGLCHLGLPGTYGSPVRGRAQLCCRCDDIIQKWNHHISDAMWDALVWRQNSMATLPSNHRVLVLKPEFPHYVADTITSLPQDIIALGTSMRLSLLGVELPLASHLWNHGFPCLHLGTGNPATLLPRPKGFACPLWVAIQGRPRPASAQPVANCLLVDSSCLSEAATGSASCPMLWQV